MYTSFVEMWLSDIFDKDMWQGHDILQFNIINFKENLTLSTVFGPAKI